MISWSKFSPAIDLMLPQVISSKHYYAFLPPNLYATFKLSTKR